MSIWQLIQEYSNQPELVVLAGAYPGESNLPGMTALSVPANALDLTGTALRTTLEQQVQQKGKKPYRRQVDTLLIHRRLDSITQATADTSQLLGVLAQVPDCSHSHLVLELNVLAFLLKLPASVALSCYVHFNSLDLDEPAEKPELVTVQRVPDLIKALLNDAFQRRRRATVISVAPNPEATADTAATGTAGPADDSGGASSRTGGSSPTGSPAPSRAPEVQQIRRGLQQQSLF